MSLFNVAAILVSLAALFSYLNTRFFRLHASIGLMAMSLLISLGVILLGTLNFSFDGYARELVGSIDFEETFTNGMLSFLLFAGALQINLDDLAQEKKVIGLLSIAGTVISTLLVGVAAYYIFPAVGLKIGFVYCLLFGALISPTDPVAVLAIMRKAKLPRKIETQIAGESIFNDGIGVVIFVVLLSIVNASDELTFVEIGRHFLAQAAGGILLGLGIGYVGYWLMRQIDNFQTEILLTLALVMGGYSLARLLHTSGPLAMVVVGLLIGNHGRAHAMSPNTRVRLDSFWELIDDMLNAVLFVLIGLEVLVVTLKAQYAVAGLLAIPLILLIRFIMVAFLLRIGGAWTTQSWQSVKILTWGGLRGGLAVALALGLPTGPERDALLMVTYIVVVSSILGQGLSMPYLIEKMKK